jgi:hypothetical protein
MHAGAGTAVRIIRDKLLYDGGPPVHPSLRPSGTRNGPPLDTGLSLI